MRPGNTLTVGTAWTDTNDILRNINHLVDQNGITCTDCTITTEPSPYGTSTIKVDASMVAYNSLFVGGFANSDKISLRPKAENTRWAIIDDVKVIVPNKVVTVVIKTASEKYTYKQVCKDPDTFDLRFAVALGIVKYFDKVEKRYGYSLTNAGREVEAYRLRDIYETTSKAIDQAIKDMEKKEKAKEKAKKCADEIKAIKERRREKNKRKREKRRERRRTRAIEGE